MNNKIIYNNNITNKRIQNSIYVLIYKCLSTNNRSVED